MFQRFFFSYGFFTLGLIGISFGMSANGAATPRNPVWLFISQLRTFCVLTWVVPIGIATLGFAMHWFWETWAKEALSQLQARETKEEVAAREARYRKLIAEKELIGIEQEKKRKEREEKEKLLEERSKREIEEKRKKVTAEEAAQSALKDFL